MDLFIPLKIQQFTRNNYWKIFWLILCIAFLLRVFVTFFSGLTWFTVDSYQYLKMADSILYGEPYSRFPNGFPLLIAFFKLWLPQAWIPYALVTLNILLSTTVVGLCIKISKMISGNTILALLAGFFITVFPNQLNYVRQILSETPTTFFLVLSIFLFFKRTYFLSGLILVITILFRTSLLPLLPLMIVCIYFFERDKELKTQLFKYTGGMITILIIYGALLIIGVVKSSSNLGVNILISISSYGGDINYSLEGLSKEYLTNHPLQSYIMFAVDHPVEFLRQRVLSFNELWLWPSDGTPPRGLFNKLLISLKIPVLIGTIVAICYNFKKVEIWILFLPILMITVIHTLFFSTPRFTYVIESFAIILSLVGLFEIMNSNKATNATKA